MPPKRKLDFDAIEIQKQWHPLRSKANPGFALNPSKVRHTTNIINVTALALFCQQKCFKMSVVFAELSKAIPLPSAQQFPIAELIMSYCAFPNVEYLFASISSLRQRQDIGVEHGRRVIPLRAFDMKLGPGKWVQLSWIDWPDTAHNVRLQPNTSHYERAALFQRAININGEAVTKEDGECAYCHVQYTPLTGKHSMRVGGGFCYVGNAQPKHGVLIRNLDVNEDGHPTGAELTSSYVW